MTSLFNFNAFEGFYLFNSAILPGREKEIIFSFNYSIKMQCYIYDILKNKFSNFLERETNIFISAHKDIAIEYFFEKNEILISFFEQHFILFM